MNKAKMIKGMVKTKKESVMGKLGDAPYDDPMEPWSAKFNAPVKNEEVEQIDEISKEKLLKYKDKAGMATKAPQVGVDFKATDLPPSHPQSPESVYKKKLSKRMAGITRAKARLNKEDVENLEEDSWLYSYIKSLGYNPKIMNFAQRSKYARSNAFKHWKQSHMERRPGQTAAMEEVEQIDEAGTGLLMTYIKAKGLNPLTMNGNQRQAYSRSSEFKIFKQKHQKEEFDRLVGTYGADNLMDILLQKQGLQETSGMGERGDDWNEESTPKAKKKKIKEEADKADTVTMDIPLLIRVLEYAREDAKTDMDLHKVVENLIKMRDEGTLSMAQYDAIVKLKEEIERIDELKKQSDTQELDSVIAREDLRKWFSKTDPEGGWKRINSKGEAIGPCAREPGEPKPKCMSNEKRAQLSKKERAAAVAAKRKHDPVADRSGKGGKPVNVSNYGKGKLGEEVEQLDEKNSPTNPKLWSRAKALARSKFDVYPSAYANGWASKWYKSKGGGWKSVKEDVVQEGLGNVEDSPMSATNSVKAMESSHRKQQMKSARMIKSLYKKKVKESLYDWEKDDKPNAKIVVKGGTTMTGQPRDTIEIEPVLKTRPNQTKPTV